MEQNATSTGILRVQSERVIKTEIGDLMVENQRHAWSFAVALFYLSGFLALNAHLSKFGVAEFEILNARFLPAASNFAFFLLCYGLFAGRIVVFIHDWITETGKRVEQSGKAGSIWQVVVAVRSLTLPIFSICFASALYCGVALQQAHISTFYGVLALAFALSYMLETGGFSSKYPRANELIELVIDLTGIVVFFTLGDGDVLVVFWIYVGISCHINYALDIMSRRERRKSIYAFFVLNSTIGVLILALVFGAKIYDRVSQKIGGGKSHTVRLFFDERVREVAQSVFLGANESLEAELLYQTEKYLFLGYGGRTLRVKNEDVRLLDLEQQMTIPSAVSHALSPASESAPSASR
jgi:hypothetical protein